ncbi:MAG: PmoA family protein [Planctomycetia bacterium]|nr:PmoA family protein [Planctomycetia bacterium]
MYKNHCPLLALLVLAGIAAPASAQTKPVELPVVPEGFRVNLFARDPFIRNPASMAFDAKGRLCVGQGPQYRNPKPDTPGDSVIILTDTDGDGVADSAKTFATGFNCIQALAWKGNDLWVANAPDLTIVRDLDGDDEADEYVLVYTDLGNLEHGLHGLNWGPDGKLYMSKGNSKGLTKGDRIAPKPFRDLWAVPAPPGAPDFPPVRVFKKGEYQKAYHDPADDWGREGGVLRCDDLGRNLEIVSRGMRNPWDITFDDGFHFLGTDNDQTGGDKLFMPFPGAHFGWGHPWSFHWSGENHLPTAPASGPLFEGSGTGTVFYHAEQFPASHRGVFYVNDWLRKTVFLYRPHWEGALLKPAGGDMEPFVKAGKSLFNPTDNEVGPDGALYVMSWGTQYGVSWGKNRQQDNEGRVYRITHGEATRAPLEAKRAKPYRDWTFAELAEDLGHQVPVWRVNAQEELVRRGPAVRADLLKLLQQRELPKARQTWAAWTLARLAPEDAEIDAFFARCAEPKHDLNLRLQALRILAHRIREFGKVKQLPASAVAALRDPEPRVRFEAVLALRQARQAHLLAPLTDLAAAETDRVTFYAAWGALAELTDADTLRTMLRDPRGGVRRAGLLALIAASKPLSTEVQPLRLDEDAGTADVAALWMSKFSRQTPPVLSVEPAGGDFIEMQAVKLVSRVPDAAVHYTLDGTNPTPQSPALTAPLSLTADAQVQVILVRDGKRVGPLVSARFHRLTDEELRKRQVAGTGTVLKLRGKATTAVEVLPLVSQGNPQRGRDLFLGANGAQCSRCHRLAGQGNAFAPDLADIGQRAKAPEIVQSILEPSALITQGFSAHVILTTEGKVHTGILLQESALEVVLVGHDGKPVRIDRETIEERHVAKHSAMPDDFAKLLDARQVADLTAFLLTCKTSAAPPVEIPEIGFAERTGELAITSGGKPVATYVFNDPKIARPFLAHIQAPGGRQVTRNHPPTGKDARDHDTMHPGIWLGFGDLARTDFWRNQGKVVHEKFTQAPKGGRGEGSFTVLNNFLAGEKLICRQTCRYMVAVVPQGTLLLIDSTFEGDSEFDFGAQEEMGLGVRVATPLTVQAGGRMLDADGRQNEKHVWGKQSDWCDYSGLLDGQRLGMTIMPDPKNAQKCWFHARDYGVLVANPFGQRAGGPARTVVKPGDKLKLRFGVLLHSSPAEKPIDLATAYRDFVKRLERDGE